ncbi:MAG: DUF3638 domain-containing protein [Tatlockia sp.]|jgi:hypothetical protein
MTITAALHAHITNDAHLSGTYGLEGMSFTITTQYLKDYLSYRTAKGKAFPFSYTRYIDDLTWLIKIEQKLQKMSSEEVNALGKEIAHEIMQLAVGKKISLPGGWRNKTGGHAMIYEFIRRENGYQFKVINTGAGLNYHAKKSSSDKELYNPVKLWNIPTLTSPVEKNELGYFINRLLQVQLREQKDACTAEILYERIFPGISYINGVEIEPANLAEFGYTAGQLSGTCAQRCHHMVLKLNSPTEKAYQAFIFDFKNYANKDYINACLSGAQPVNAAVRKQIHLALENSFKILNTPALFNEIQKTSFYNKLKTQQKKTMLFPQESIQKQIPDGSPVPKLYLSTLSKQFAKPKIDKPFEKKIQGYSKIDLANGKNLIKNLSTILNFIQKTTSLSMQYYHLEKLILALPINDTHGLTNPFYNEIRLTSDYANLESCLNRMQDCLLNLQKNWLKTARIPALTTLNACLLSLQIDTRDELNRVNKLPSFTPLASSMMKAMIGNSQRNPFWATNHPMLDRRFNALQARFSGALKIEESESYLQALLEEKPALKTELRTRYSAKYGQNLTELHQSIRKRGLEALFLLSDHLEGNKKLPERYHPLIELVEFHLKYESRLASGIQLFLEWHRSTTPTIKIEKECAVGPVNFYLLYYMVHFREAAEHKYALPVSPARDALLCDLPRHGSRALQTRSANHIQLNPNQVQKKKDATRQITYQDRIARDYFHLRSVPSLQIALTLDYFTLNVAKLAKEADQRYVEANLFQPGLLEQAIQHPFFWPQFDTFLSNGNRFFTCDGLHTPTSLFFLRLDYLVSRYYVLMDNEAGQQRLHTLQTQIQKQLSQPNKPEVIYVQQHYLFLVLMTRFESGDKSLEPLKLAMAAYFYLQGHDNPLILEDLAHKIEVDRVIAQFQILLGLQSEEELKLIIEKLFANEGLKLIRSCFPSYHFLKGSQQVQFNARLGKFIENNLVKMEVPFSIKKHALINHLQLDTIDVCLSSIDKHFFLLSNEKEEVHLYSSTDTLVVQKKWSVNGQNKLYELVALTRDHLACQANPKSIPIANSLPESLTDGSFDYWQEIATPANGLLVQNNIPLYLVKSNQFIVLDSEGRESSYQLQIPGQRVLALFNSFESSPFILSQVSAEEVIVQLPRYNLIFQHITKDQTDCFINRETGEQVIESQSPIHPAVAGLLLQRGSQTRYLVPVNRFYATEFGATVSDFYPVVHDKQNTIAQAQLTDYVVRHKLASQVMWHHQNSQKFISFNMEEGKPIPNTVADALYLAYIMLVTNQPEQAWNLLKDCNAKFGGLTGDPAELQCIVWICEELPHILKASTLKPRETPPDIACQLKVLSLLTDYLFTNRKFNLQEPQDNKTANSVSEQTQFNALNQFLLSLPIKINTVFTRYQSMRRHLEKHYTLSRIERKQLLDFCHHWLPAVGALGYEQLALQVETLQRERDFLLARNHGGPNTQPNQKRLDLIETKLQQLQPVMACSTRLEEVPINLLFPKNHKLVINADSKAAAWHKSALGKAPIDKKTMKEARELLSSALSDEDFLGYFPAYLAIACGKKGANYHRVLDFCRQTLKAHRNIPLAMEQSNIPFLCHVLYRVGNHPRSVATYLAKNTVHFDQLVRQLDALGVAPIKVFQVKEIYQTLLARPEELLAPEKAVSLALVNPTLQEGGLKIQQGIEKVLAEHNPQRNALLNQLVADYRALEKQLDSDLNALGKTLTHNLEHQFAIEQSAGVLLFNVEKEKKRLAEQMVNEPELVMLTLKAACQTLPSLLAEKEKAWDEALTFANQGPETAEKARTWKIEKRARTRTALTKACLRSIYCSASQAVSVEKTGLNPDKAQPLHDRIHTALVQDIQHQIAEKLIENLEKVLEKKDLDLALQSLDYLAKKKIPGLHVPARVIIQQKEAIVLRKRQVRALKHLTEVPDDSQPVIEQVKKLPPGLGKTKVVAPDLAEEKAQGDNLVVFEVPAASLNTNHIDSNAYSQRVYNKRAYRFEFDRDSDCSPDRLEQMYQLFTEIMTTRSYMVTTGESIQSLGLKYLEFLLQEKETEAWQAQVFWLDKITNLFRHHADCIIDEAHIGLWIKKKLNYTFGEAEKIAPSLIHDAIRLYDLIDVDFIQKAQRFPLDYNWTDFQLNLATKLVEEENSPIYGFARKTVLTYGQAFEKKIIDYLLDKDEGNEVLILASVEEKKSLAFFKEQITSALPDSLRAMLDVHYGPSKLNNLSAIEYALAIPYGSNNLPKEKSRFGNVLKVINCTIQMMLLSGLNESLLKAQIIEWQALARGEFFQVQVQEQTLKNIDKTPTARGFALLAKGSGFKLSQINVNDPLQMARLQTYFKTNRALISVILKEKVLKQITQDSCIISSDSFNHVDQYRSVQCLSGTPSPTTFHQRLHFNPLHSLGTDGYILEVLNDKNTGLSFVDMQNVPQFLETALHESVAKYSTRAIVDINATFSGISNQAIAKKLAKLIKNHAGLWGRAIKHVLYFNEEQILCALEVSNSGKRIEIGTSEEKAIAHMLGTTPAERFTYYDQAHSQGTDIKQALDANALVLIDENISMEDYLQGVMRMRELSQGQRIHLIAPQRLKGISRLALTEQLRVNARQLLLIDNFFTAKGRMRNDLRHLALSRIQDLPSEEAQCKAALTQQFKSFFVDIPSHDLVALYGGMNKKKQSSELLNRTRLHLLDLWKSCNNQVTNEECERIERNLQDRIREAIPLCIEEYSSRDNALTEEVQILTEIHKELQKERIDLNACFDPQLQEAPFQPWTSDEVAAFYQDKLLLEGKSGSLNALCSISESEPVSFFSSTLRASHNYANVYQSQEQFLHVFLKPVFLVWYHFERETLHALIVTPQEEAQLREWINPLDKSWIATTQDTVVAGTPPEGVLHQENYQILREQVRFFNGEIESLQNQKTPLLWLKEKPIEKIDFFKNKLQQYRPNVDCDLDPLLTSILKGESAAFFYIAQHPFEDLTQFDWMSLYPNSLSVQVAEYKKLASVFVYITRFWLEKELSEKALQHKFQLPLSYLSFFKPTLRQLATLKKVLPHFAQPEEPLVDEERNDWFKHCLGVSYQRFYDVAAIDGLEKEEVRHFLNIKALFILQNYPACKDKPLIDYFKESVAQITLRPNLRAKVYQLFNKNIPVNFPMRELIELANQEELNFLLDYSNTGSIGEDLLILLVQKCQSNEAITHFLKRPLLDEKIILEVLNKDFLNEDLLLLLLQNYVSKKLIQHLLLRPSLPEKIMQEILKQELQESQLVQLLQLTKDTQTLELVSHHAAANRLVTVALSNHPALNTEIVLLLLEQKALSNEDLLHLLSHPGDIDATVLLAILKKKGIDASVISSIIAHPKVNASVIAAAIDSSAFTLEVSRQLIAKLSFLDESECTFANRLLMRNKLDVNQLHALVDKIPDYKNLRCFLNHPLFTKAERKIWLEKMLGNKMQRKPSHFDNALFDALDQLKGKACKLVIKAIDNPDYIAVANTAIGLYRKLRLEIESSTSQDKGLRLTNCKEAIKDAIPVLKTHRGHKQDLLDGLNILLAVITFGLLPCVTGDWRFFKADTASYKVVDKLSKQMR